MTEKIPKIYDPVAFERILKKTLGKKVDNLSTLKLKRIKSISGDASPNLQINEPGYVLDDNQNFDFVVRAEDGRLYRLTGAVAATTSSLGSGGTTDHAALDNLAYADAGHTGFQATSTLTTKGDIYVRHSSDVSRLAVGSDGQLLIPDSPSTVGMKWGNLLFYDDELLSYDDEILTV